MERRCGGQHEHRAPAAPEKSSSSFPQAPSGVVQEKILQAGLRNVHVAQVNRGGGGEIGNLGNQRASAISVHIGGVVITGSHLSDPSEGFETPQQLDGMLAEAQSQQIAAGDRSLQLRGSAQRDVASMKSTCGSCIMARAIERRCIMPPEKPRTI